MRPEEAYYLFMAKIKTNKPAKPSTRVVASSIKTLEEIISNKQSPIDVQELAYEFMSKIGGNTGFVDMVLTEYNGSEIGSLARARVLDIMLKLFQLASPKDGGGDFANISDDDLKNILQAQLGVPKQENWPYDICI